MPHELTRLKTMDHGDIWVDLDKVLAIQATSTDDRCMVWFEHLPGPLNVACSASKLKFAAEAATRNAVKACQPLPAVGR